MSAPICKRQLPSSFSLDPFTLRLTGLQFHVIFHRFYSLVLSASLPYVVISSSTLSIFSFSSVLAFLVLCNRIHSAVTLHSHFFRFYYCFIYITSCSLSLSYCTHGSANILYNFSFVILDIILLIS